MVSYLKRAAVFGLKKKKGVNMLPVTMNQLMLKECRVVMCFTPDPSFAHRSYTPENVLFTFRTQCFTIVPLQFWDK